MLDYTRCPHFLGKKGNVGTMFYGKPTGRVPQEREVACVQVWKHLVMDAKLRASAAAQSARAYALSPKGASTESHSPTRTAGGGEEQQPPAWRALHPGLAALTALEDPEEVVLSNILVDGAPLVGRARLQLQFLWRDIAGRCCTLQADYMP